MLFFYKNYILISKHKLKRNVLKKQLISKKRKNQFIGLRYKKLIPDLKIINLEFFELLNLIKHLYSLGGFIKFIDRRAYIQCIINLILKNYKFFEYYFLEQTLEKYYF